MLHYPHTNCIVFTGVILPPQPCSISQGNSLNLTIHSESILLRPKINEVPCTTPEIHYHDWMIGWKIPQKFQEENTPSTSTTTLENPPSSFHWKYTNLQPPTSNIQHSSPSDRHLLTSVGSSNTSDFCKSCTTRRCCAWRPAVGKFTFFTVKK